MHQLHQLHGQFIFVKTCSYKESSDGLIKANQKKTEVIDGKLSKSYQDYQAAFQERAHVFQFCGYTCVVSRRDTGNPRFSVTFGCNRSRIQPRSGSSTMSWK